jgi:hypothetical protein
MNETNSLDTVLVEVTDSDLPTQQPRPLTEVEKLKRRQTRRKFGWPDEPPLTSSNPSAQ